MFACLAAASVIITSCADSAPEEGGGVTPPVTNAGVFFYSAKESVIAKATKDTLKFAVGRANAGYEDTYSIQATVVDSLGNSADELFEFPENVTFLAGETSDTIAVMFDNIIYGMEYKVNLAFEDKDTSPYANGSISFTLMAEDPDAWELLTDSAVFVNNFWSCLLSGSTTGYKGVKVKKYKGKDLFRIYGLPETFQYEWTTTYMLAPDCELTVDEDYAIELDCETYSDPKSRIKKVYMPFQTLGVKLNQLDGAAYCPGEVWAGSVAHNLQSASTGEYMTEAKYPLGTYDTVKGVFHLGQIAVDFGDDLLGIQLCQGETSLYLDESNMETDVRDLLYKNVRRAVFHSKAYLEDDGSYMSQGTKLAQCISEDYEDAEKTFRINSPYTSSADLYFTHDKKTNRVKFLEGQPVGSTALGGYPILCEAKTAQFVKTDEKESYLFNMTFYYVNDEGTRYDLGTFKEELELGSEITYYTAEDLDPSHPIDDYVGEWVGEFTFIQDLNQTVKSTVTIEKDDDYTLIIRGLAPYMESQNGYDSSLYLDYNDETGVFDFAPQYANTFNSYQINVYTANLDDPNSDLYMEENLMVGFLKNGNITFVNNPDNNHVVNCAVYYTPAQGGALVEPFVPYNLVLERQSSEARPAFPSGIKSMVPWQGMRETVKGKPSSHGRPAFTFSQSASSARQYLKLRTWEVRR